MHIAFFINIIYCHRRIFTSEPTIVYQCPNSIVSIRIHAEGLKHDMMTFTHHHKRQKREYFHCPTTDLGQLASPFSLAQLCPFTWWQPCSACPFQTQEFGSLPPPSMCFHNLLTQLFWWRRRFLPAVWMKHSRPSHLLRRTSDSKFHPFFKQIFISTTP